MRSLPFQVRAGQEQRAFADDRVERNIGCCRVLHAHPGFHPAPVNPPPHRGFRLGEVGAGVDPDPFLLARDGDSLRAAFARRQRHQVSQVIFALGGGFHFGKRRPQPISAETIGAQVDFVDLFLLLGGVRFLDDLPDGARRVAHHPPESACVFACPRQERQWTGSALSRFHERPQRLRFPERHVAVENQNVFGFPAQETFRAADRIGRSQQRRLLDQFRQVAAQRPHGVGSVPDDKNRLLRADGSRDLERPEDHWPAAERMQHLRPGRFHPSPQPGGKNDHSNRHGGSSLGSALRPAKGTLAKKRSVPIKQKDSRVQRVLYPRVPESSAVSGWGARFRT